MIRAALIVVGLALCFTAGAAQGAPPSRAECFMFGRMGGSIEVSDRQECGRPTSPASTFKLPHALIAIEAGVVTPDTVFKWDGTRFAHDSWRRDHTLTSAIQWSVVPYFQWTARQLGRERMTRGLATLQYAADTFTGDIAQFWLNGDLVVSPVEQFAFLRRLTDGTLSASQWQMATVLAAMRMPTGQVLMAAGTQPFELRWPTDTVVRAKTGNTIVDDERVSWLVGSLSRGDESHLFVARVRVRGELPASAGVDLAQREINARVRPGRPG